MYPNDHAILGKGKVCGRLLGELEYDGWDLGSKYMPDLQAGDILLIEDSLKGIESVERSFSPSSLWCF